ncbi:hypothetical protein BU26DRAFT_516038 [Trematosphaeria pertusa]|uniref:Uncharacterized protein n=1 Tax=Trematosphaeria pertusa TaxID=390896 RepID=A0A6A6ITE4_9PLEO|nr:uncharacterized protein BU26DRAFT_516038 [Trematosphaeria pertusa]KAF2253734.1 hypothetical protein BU26DRAFT_516038 [Trematosphaeria pertusa]
MGTTRVTARYTCFERQRRRLSVPTTCLTLAIIQISAYQSLKAHLLVEVLCKAVVALTIVCSIIPAVSSGVSRASLLGIHRQLPTQKDTKLGGEFGSKNCAT